MDNLLITILQRPFIIVYEDQSETEEIGVYNLTSARVDYKTDLEEMLQVRVELKGKWLNRRVNINAFKNIEKKHICYIYKQQRIPFTSIRF